MILKGKPVVTYDLSHFFSFSISSLLLKMDIEALKRLEKVFDTVDSNPEVIKKPKIDSFISSETSTSETNTIDVKNNNINNLNSTSLSTPANTQEWSKYYDPSSSRFYYHNAVTNVTQWEVPEGFIEPLVDVVQSSSLYASTASFSLTNGAFSLVGTESYWDKVNRPNDREGRQMSAFFDLNDLDKNRQEAKRKQEVLKKSGIDWRKYKEEKKAMRKKKRNEWLLKD
jgi:hypothetical protein